MSKLARGRARWGAGIPSNYQKILAILSVGPRSQLWTERSGPVCQAFVRWNLEYAIPKELNSTIK